MTTEFLYIPLDILKVISSYLHCYHLSLNKYLHDIYDDNWYREYIKRKYSLFPCIVTNYKDLYERSLIEGKLYQRGNGELFSFNIKGIKIEHYYMGSITIGPFDKYSDIHEILNFKGDLFLSDGSNRILIDTNVSDFAYELYIKKGKLYSFSNGINKKRVIEITKTCKFVTCIDALHYNIATDYKVYYCYENKKVNSIKFENKIINMIKSDQFITILLSSGILYRLNKYLSYHEIFDNTVSKLYPDIYIKDNKYF